jgi:urease accessory protein
MQTSSPNMNTLEVQCNNGKSVVTRQYATYPVRFVKLNNDFDDCCHIYTLSYGGGLVSGDKCNMDITVGESANLCIRTQGSTKVYKNSEGKVTQQTIQATVRENSLLALLPDPVVGYADSRYLQSQSFDLHKDGSLVVVDWFTCGRGALRNEFWQQNSISTDLRIIRDGKAVLIDNLLLQNSSSGSISLKVGHSDVFGTMIIMGQKTRGIAEILLSMSKRETFREKRVGMKRKSDFLTGETNIHDPSHAPLISCSKLAQEDDAYVFRFIAFSTESAYKLLAEVLRPLCAVTGTFPYIDRLVV